MSTLLLRLAAPIQSWGDESKYEIRHTHREPTKSGVIGLAAAALGLSRDSREIPALAERLRMGVRVDQEGVILTDFQTALPPKRGKRGETKYSLAGELLMEDNPYVSTRYYLCDACFLVGLECSDGDFLRELAQAFGRPAFPLYLGRRACPPTLPVLLGIRDCSLEGALRGEPWLAAAWYRRKHPAAKLPILLESEKGQTAWHSVRDQPVSFSPIYRRYAFRAMGKEQSVSVVVEEHDPFSQL